jgi:hypothetical protein
MMNRCIVCGGEAVKIYTINNSTDVYRCMRCYLEYAHPMPSDNVLKKYYADYDYATLEDIRDKNIKKNIKLLFNYGLTKEKSLLDFGSGDNRFVSLGKTKNWVGYNYPVQKIPYGRYDWITLWGVLEHLPNPVGTIKYLSENKLNKGGKIVITTVLTETLAGIPYRYKYPEHLTWWSRCSLFEVLLKGKIAVQYMADYNMIQNPQEYLKAVLNRAGTPDEIKKLISIRCKEDIKVPTNEVLVIGVKE